MIAILYIILSNSGNTLKLIDTTYTWKHSVIPTTVIMDAVGIVKTL